MTTPKREQILQLAKELYFNDVAKSGINNFNDPEPNELAESGYIQTARSMLMRDQYRSQIENNKDFFETENLDFQFDSNEAMQTTCFVSGSRGVGKSDVAMRIVDSLTNENVICVVFDSSLDWVKRSSIRQYITVKPYADLPIPKQNTIIDMSQLTPMQQQSIVEQFCKILFESQVNNLTNKYYVVFEESQLYFPLNSIRAKRYQNSARLLTVGRNIGVSLCAISQFPALIDKELVKHAGQIYIGYSTELNTLAYWRGILGNHTEKLKELSNGQFVYYHRNKISLTEIEAFQNTTTKTQIQRTNPKPIEPIYQNSNATSTLAIAIMWFLAILAALSQFPKW